MQNLEIVFEGFWQCRLATDPDPSNEQRGITGFTYALVGETLLDNVFYSQGKDIKNLFGEKDDNFKDITEKPHIFYTKNIREASPDYQKYNQNGIGIKVTNVIFDGTPVDAYQDSTVKKELLNLIDCLVRFEPREIIPGEPWKDPVFEGRNQIISDGDPDRFTLNPFVISISKENENKDETLLLKRFDPLDIDKPDNRLINIDPDPCKFNEIVSRRLPVQRFALSEELLEQVGIKKENLKDHFTNRARWLAGKVLEAEAIGNLPLAQAYKSRLFAINFFTQSTGPTVLSNRLLSRIPLRQLYRHSIRGNNKMDPKPFVSLESFKSITIDTENDWDIMYYLGAFDGDLLAGWCSGVLFLPVTSNVKSSSVV